MGKNMGKNKNDNKPENRADEKNINTEQELDDEEMTVELELEDGSVVNCAVITILTVEKKDYIVLLPLNEDGENTDGEVWFYSYSENPEIGRAHV